MGDNPETCYQCESTSDIGDFGVLGAEGCRTTADGRNAPGERLFHLRGNWGQLADQNQWQNKQLKFKKSSRHERTNCSSSCNDTTKFNYHKAAIYI